jgi:hypothetical protein
MLLACVFCSNNDGTYVVIASAAMLVPFLRNSDSILQCSTSGHGRKTLAPSFAPAAFRRITPPL